MDPATIFQIIYPPVKFQHLQNDTHTVLFIAAFFVIARVGNNQMPIK